MFDTLSQRLQSVWDRLRRQPRITEDVLKEALREVRIALIEADVGLPIVKKLVADIQQDALGQDVTKSLSPDQMVIKIVLDHLMALLGEELVPLTLESKHKPCVHMMVGLQGAGKTTTSVKLAWHVTQKHKKKVGLCSLDVYRPAAREQLSKIASSQGLACFDPDTDDVLQRAEKAFQWAQEQQMDLLILDTAGRLHTDDVLMDELKRIQDRLHPTETLLVADSMTGQDAVGVASVFHQALSLTGIILTRLDGDARGGACLSVRAATGCPIKFLGHGEKTQALEPFHPDRIARRILGMGDVLSLIDQATQAFEQDEQEKLAQRAAKGLFDLNDMLTQMQSLQKMGGLQSLVKMLPQNVKVQATSQELAGSESEIKTHIAIIRAMTPAERLHPKLLNGSRRKRIAQGAGTNVMMVNRLLKRYQMFAEVTRRMRDHKALKRQGLGALFRPSS